MKNHLCIHSLCVCVCVCVCMHSYLGYDRVSKWLRTTEREEVKELRGFSNIRSSTEVVLERVIHQDAKI